MADIPAASAAPAAPPAAPPAPATAAATPPADPAVTPPPAGGEPPKPTLAGEPPKAEPKADEPAAFDAGKLQLPEGMKTDDPTFKSFSDIMSDANLSPQDRGQKLLSLYTDTVKASQEAQRTAWNQLNESWVKEVKADPEIGGAKFEGVKTSIAKAIDSLGPELSVAFRQGLDVTGAGNHPAIWKGLAKMAALLTEGGHVSGNPPKDAEKQDIAKTFFPNSNMT